MINIIFHILMLIESTIIIIFLVVVISLIIMGMFRIICWSDRDIWEVGGEW